MAKKLHWRTKIKREIERWERSLQSAGRKNRWGIEKREYVKKYGIDNWNFEQKRRKGLEKYWKKQRDAKRYRIERLKDKLDPKRIMRRKFKKIRREIASGARDSGGVTFERNKRGQWIDEED